MCVNTRTHSRTLLWIFFFLDFEQLVFTEPLIPDHKPWLQGEARTDGGTADAAQKAIDRFSFVTLSSEILHPGGPFCRDLKVKVSLFFSTRTKIM